jgi:hypothetical protein
MLSHFPAECSRAGRPPVDVHGPPVGADSPSRGSRFPALLPFPAVRSNCLSLEASTPPWMHYLCCFSASLRHHCSSPHSRFKIDYRQSPTTVGRWTQFGGTCHSKPRGEVSSVLCTLRFGHGETTVGGESSETARTTNEDRPEGDSHCSTTSTASNFHSERTKRGVHLQRTSTPSP